MAMEEEVPRPGAPRVLGVLSIVFGSLVVAFSLFGLVSPGMSRGMYHGEALAALDAYMDALQPWSAIINIVMMLMSVALIFIGIGQRRYRRWARGATITWGWLALLILVGQFAIWLTVISPALEVFIERISNSMLGGLGSPLSGLTSNLGFISLFFYAPYPIILIIFMGKPKIERAMIE